MGTPVRGIQTDRHRHSLRNSGDDQRFLVVTADDFGIGLETSRGILELASEGLVTCTVLLVNSPHAEASVQLWKQSGASLELGWHPCLTLDRPVLPAERVESLVDRDGFFWPLKGFLRRLCLGQLRAAEIEAELRAQYARFVDLIGQPPTVVNSHHHVQIFSPVSCILSKVLADCQPLPYLRRNREPWTMLTQVPGARLKRMLINLFGRRVSRNQEADGFPGNDCLIGVTDPRWIADPEFFTRCLAHAPGRIVELACHPGHFDPTLLGRDATATDGNLQRRVQELKLLREPSFRSECQKAHLKLIGPSDLLRHEWRIVPVSHVAA